MGYYVTINVGSIKVLLSIYFSKLNKGTTNTATFSLGCIRLIGHLCFYKIIP